MSMPAIERVIPLVGHLPASIREALARRLRELAGLGLVALSGVAAAALMTWSVQDPSLSHATSRPIRNVVGHPGAISADLLMQILGLGSIMLILPVAVWGWRMLTHRSTATHCGSRAGSCAQGSGRDSRAAGRTAARGRFPPDLEGLSAMRWCAPPLWCSGRLASSIAWCSGFSFSPRALGHS